MWLPGRRDTESTIRRVSSAGRRRSERAVGDRDVLGQAPLARPYGARHHPGHPGVTLQTRDVGRAVLADPDLGDEAGHRREGDPGLAQRGEDLLDVAEEERVGTDHQHALPLEREPVGVEQIGGTVEGNGRLAGAGAALHDQHPAERGTDDLVLLALDRGDDVGHPAGPGTVEGGEEGGWTADGQVADDELARCGLPPGDAHPLFDELDTVFGQGEPLVLDPHDLAALEGEVAAEDESLGVATGGPVEGLGNRGPPVDDERLVVCSVDGQSTDVEGLGVRDPVRAVGGRGGPVARAGGQPVDPPEGECLVPDVQLLEPGQAGAHDDVPLGPGLEGAALAQVEHALEHRIGIPAHGVEPRVGEVDERLLGLQLRCHPPPPVVPCPPRTALARPRGTLDCMPRRDVVPRPPGAGSGDPALLDSCYGHPTDDRAGGSAGLPAVTRP